MNTDNVKVDIIKKSLDKIIANTLWLAALDLIALLGLLNKKGPLIGIGNFSIPNELMGIFLFCAAIILFISHIHKLDRITTVYPSIEDAVTKQATKLYLNLYPSILNPFGQHDESKKSILFDNLSRSIYSLLYLMALTIGLRYIPIGRGYGGGIAFTVFLLLLYFMRNDVIQAEKDAYAIFNTKFERVRFVLLLVMLITYLVFYFLLF